MGRDLAEWKSFEALEETIRRDTKDVADALYRSLSIVSKWKEAPSTQTDPDQSGTRNPLDILKIIISTIKEKDPARAYLPIFWLCARFGFLPPVKAPDGSVSDEELLQAILAWHKEFGETCKVISIALEDNRVKSKEYKDCFKEAMNGIQALMGVLAMMKSKIE